MSRKKENAPSQLARDLANRLMQQPTAPASLAPTLEDIERARERAGIALDAVLNDAQEWQLHDQALIIHLLRLYNEGSLSPSQAREVKKLLKQKRSKIQQEE